VAPTNIPFPRAVATCFLRCSVSENAILYVFGFISNYLNCYDSYNDGSTLLYKCVIFIWRLSCGSESILIHQRYGSFDPDDEISSLR